MNRLVKYRSSKENIKSLIFCQFCQKYFYSIFFTKHLQYCQSYIKHNQPKKLAIEWNNRRERVGRPLRNRVDRNIFNHLIKDKRVIIVGPSMTVQECSLGNFIDSFDIVVRLNKSLPIPLKMRNHIGSRTDILYNSLNVTDYPGENNINPIFLRNQRIKYLRSPYPPITPFKYDIRNFQERNRGTIPFGHIDNDYYRRLRHGIQTRPYTGTSAIADILHHSPKELYIMGIDFYTYGYTKYYRKVSDKKLERLRNNTIHKRGPQIDLIRRFYLLDNKVVVDNILDKILLEEYDSLFYTISSQVELKKTCITLNENYLGSTSVLNKALQMAKKLKNNTNKYSICILGDLSPEDIDIDQLDRFDLIIDLFPNRSIKLINPPQINVFHSLDEWRPEILEKGQTSLITQSFRKDIQYKIDMEKLKLPLDDTYLLNPLFTKYLRSILSQSVIKEGMISTEVFIALYIVSYFGELAEVKVAHFDPCISWTSQPAHLRQRLVSQRLLYKYLLKREFITEL